MESNQRKFPSSSSASWERFLERPHTVRAVPSDLREAVGEKPLINIVLGAVYEVSDRALGLKSLPGGLSPRMMLTLATYSYASGVLGSRHIEEILRENRMMRYICANTFPTDRDLRHFRRDHRQLIAQCLSHVLQQAWAVKLDNAEVEYLGYGWYESELLQQIDQEVAQRIEVASFIDMIEFEE